MKFLFPKEFVTIFGLDQYPLQRTHLGNTLGTLGTYWELEGNLLGTKEKKWKKSLTPSHSKLKRKKNLFEFMLSLPIGCLGEISISKTVRHHFLAWANNSIINWGYLFNFYCVIGIIN